MTRRYEGRSGPRLARLAEKQHGVFSRAQAMECGLSSDTIDRRVSSAAWERLYPGIYRLAGVRATWKQSLLAACLGWGTGAVISHRAAAALWELPGFSPGTIELIVPRKRERARGHVVHRPLALPRADVTVVDAIPVTTPGRTLVDLAGCVNADVLEEALDDALRRRLVSLARMRWQLRESGGRRGIGVLAKMVCACDGGVPESSLETRLLRALRAPACRSPPSSTASAATASTSLTSTRALPSSATGIATTPGGARSTTIARARTRSPRWGGGSSA